MPRHVHADVEVPWRPATLAGRTFALQLDPLPVGYAGGDARLDSPGAQRPSAAAAGRARVIDHQATATACGARLGEREAAEVAAGLPGALAVRADLGNRASLRAGTTADLARAFVGQPQAHCRAVDGVAERQRCLGLHIGAAARPGLRGRPAAKDAAEQVTEPAAGSGRPEDVAEVESAEPAATAARHPGSAGAEERPRLVVLGASLRIGQDVVGLGDLLESLLRLGVALVGVRVVLARELAVRLLDLLGRRTLTDPESLVIVLLEEVLRTQQAPPGRGLIAFVTRTVIGSARLGCRLVHVCLGRRSVVTGGPGAGRVSRLSHCDPCRAQDPLADLVARLQHLHARRLGHVR